MHSQFEIIFEHGTGSVHRHIWVDTNHDKYAIHETIAIKLAIIGHKVEIIQEIHVKEIQLREIVRITSASLSGYFSFMQDEKTANIGHI